MLERFRCLFARAADAEVAPSDDDVAGAQRAYRDLLPLTTAMMTVTASPIPVKAAMGLIGQPVGPPRLPLVPATKDEIAAVQKALEDAGVR